MDNKEVIKMSEYKNYYQANSGLTFSEYLTKVFSTVAIGVGITTVISFVLSHFFMETLLEKFAGITTGVIFGAIILEFIVAIFFAARLNKMAKSTAWVCYILYSVLTGISLSLVFYGYTDTSVTLCFGATCLMFVTMAVIGHNTKTDLSKFSGLIMPALIAIIVVSILNVILFKSDIVQWIVNYVGVVVFLFLIAYDMQKLRTLYDASFSDEEIGEKMMIYGAFQLYLDFINLLIRILELFGKSKSND